MRRRKVFIQIESLAFAEDTEQHIQAVFRSNDHVIIGTVCSCGVGTTYTPNLRDTDYEML